VKKNLMTKTVVRIAWACLLAIAVATSTLTLGAARTRKIVLLAGRKSHGPGFHEYLKTIKLFKVMLDRSPNLHGMKTEIYFNGWPDDPKTLDDADTIAMFTDGQPSHENPRPPFMTDDRMKVLERVMKRGCGFVMVHYSTFTSYEYADDILEWAGGFYNWDNTQGKLSEIKTLEADVKLGTPGHPVLKGVSPFRYKDEFYYKLRFRQNDPRLKPIMQVPVLSSDPEEQIVSWAVERENGGRGFATTTGHFYENWKDENYRRLILNALVWTAGADVPEGGVQSAFVEDDEVDKTLMTRPIATLVLTGDSDPSHQWKETTPAIVASLNSEIPRFQVTVSEDPEVLAKEDLSRYKLIVLNYVNWNHAGLSDTAKTNFVKYLKEGGGLDIIHFADVAFGPDLPGGAAASWPEFRTICRRFWDESKSTHDPYESFRIDISGDAHPATSEIISYETKDELYGNQQGNREIRVLATARSKASGNDEPVAFVYEYGKGRIFQTVLGHDAEAIGVPGTTQLLRYGSLWAAKDR
jgi:type 1 glutamine amidotransferase